MPANPSVARRVQEHLRDVALPQPQDLAGVGYEAAVRPLFELRDCLEGETGLKGYAVVSRLITADDEAATRYQERLKRMRRRMWFNAGFKREEAYDLADVEEEVGALALIKILAQEDGVEPKKFLGSYLKEHRIQGPLKLISPGFFTQYQQKLIHEEARNISARLLPDEPINAQLDFADETLEGSTAAMARNAWLDLPGESQTGVIAIISGFASAAAGIIAAKNGLEKAPLSGLTFAACFPGLTAAYMNYRRSFPFCYYIGRDVTRLGRQSPHEIFRFNATHEAAHRLIEAHPETYPHNQTLWLPQAAAALRMYEINHGAENTQQADDLHLGMLLTEDIQDPQEREQKITEASKQKTFHWKTKSLREILTHTTATTRDAIGRNIDAAADYLSSETLHREATSTYRYGAIIAGVALEVGWQIAEQRGGGKKEAVDLAWEYVRRRAQGEDPINLESTLRSRGQI
ncbi:Uncharacterised protein [uncultured archaeon]|nr:Uncharacterised protein [uncultured archaeon]